MHLRQVAEETHRVAQDLARRLDHIMRHPVIAGLDICEIPSHQSPNFFQYLGVIGKGQPLRLLFFRNQPAVQTRHQGLLSEEPGNSGRLAQRVSRPFRRSDHLPSSVFL